MSVTTQPVMPPEQVDPRTQWVAGNILPLNLPPELGVLAPREFSAYLGPPGTQKARESRVAVVSFVPLLALQRENRHWFCKVKGRPKETQKPHNPAVL